jgi:hypothetical protein
LTEEKKAFLQEMLNKYGVPMVILAYFLWKDYTFTENVIALMTKVDTLLTQIHPLLTR